ncbi:MAG: TolC family protein [Saprospiraceae bacterium]
MYSTLMKKTPACFLLVMGWMWFVCSSLAAQTNDSLLEWRVFRREVLSNHPLARQANLATASADAVLLRAKGGFDPKLFADIHEKSFTNTQYYQYSESGIKWPGWMGIELKGAYNWAGGFYLNPESTLPANGQANLGLNWSLGQGLLMDERRADLQQAKIGLQMGVAERDAQLNDLLFAGAKAYWEWVLANTQLAVLEAALAQAQIRYEGIRESFLQGDKPAIDTLETFIQVQNRLLDVNFAQVDVQNTLLALNTYLWNADGAPLSPAEVSKPPALPTAEALQLPSPEQLLGNIDQHPQLRAYQAKLNDLGVEQRLKTEKRKPILDVQYNLLGNGWQFFPTPGAEGLSMLTNDVKWGVQFSYPILNRKARGDFR